MMKLIWIFVKIETYEMESSALGNIATENWDELRLRLQQCYPNNNGDCSVREKLLSDLNKPSRSALIR